MKRQIPAEHRDVLNGQSRTEIVSQIHGAPTRITVVDGVFAPPRFSAHAEDGKPLKNRLPIDLVVCSQIPVIQNQEGARIRVRAARLPVNDAPSEAIHGVISKRYLTEVEAALVLGLSPRTLQSWRYNMKAGPKFHRFGRGIRYSIDSIDAWARAHEIQRDHDLHD